VDCSSLLAGIESIEVEPIGKKFVHRFPAEALEKIRSKDLDVILRFGFNILSGDILTAARYGVWSYHHDDNDFYRGGPPHFWELVEKSPLSGVILQVLTEELDGGLVLCKSLFTTEQTTSASVNRYTPYWGSTDMVIRKLNELHRCGWDYVKAKSIPNSPYQGKRKIYRTPTNSEMKGWLGPLILKKAVEYPFRKKTVQHWKIAVRTGHQLLFEFRLMWTSLTFVGLSLRKTTSGLIRSRSSIKESAGRFSTTITIQNAALELHAPKSRPMAR